MTKDALHVANAFATARRTGKSIEAFPGLQPATLSEAYAIQDLELGQIEVFYGWKVAAIKPELRGTLGDERLAGPIVRLIDARETTAPIEVPAIPGGFAAVEAEFAFRIGRDLPHSTTDYSQTDLLDCVAALHIASEIAGSPLSTLSDLGPTAVISDHGNNAAVVIGREVSDWQSRALETLKAETLVNGTIVGVGDASRLPSAGPLGSLAFLVRHLASRGRYLRQGDWVATGATTGVHRVEPGDTALIDFGSDGALEMVIGRC